jgi:hypothetical protein
VWHGHRQLSSRRRKYAAKGSSRAHGCTTSSPGLTSTPRYDSPPDRQRISEENHKGEVRQRLVVEVADDELEDGVLAMLGVDVVQRLMPLVMNA